MFPDNHNKLCIFAAGQRSSMFTGIIESLGTITRTQREGTSVILYVEPEVRDFTVAVGGSVAIDGTCLTLESQSGSQLRFSAVAETLNRTTLGNARGGRKVNLERAAPIGGRLDGHFVYGHVDGIGKIVSDRDAGGSLLRTIAIPAELAPFMALKGSVAVDGISLTIAYSGSTEITISFIPHTLRHTTMAQKRPGDPVNIECDIIARYLQRLLQTGNITAPAAEQPLQELMERSGF